MGFLKDMWDGGASSAKKKNEANASALNDLLGQQYGFGISKMLEALAGLDEGYLNTKAALSTAGETATNQILETGQQTLADTKQGLVNAGLTGTTVAGNAASQISKGTSMSLASLAEQIGSLNAGVETNYANAKVGQLNNIANFAMNKVGVASSITPQYEGSGGGIAGAVGQALGGVPGALTSMFAKPKPATKSVF